MVDDRLGHRLRRASAGAAIRMSSAAPLLAVNSLVPRLPCMCAGPNSKAGQSLERPARSRSRPGLWLNLPGSLVDAILGPLDAAVKPARAHAATASRQVHQG